jgi:regulator of vacuolar morphogenesis
MSTPSLELSIPTTSEASSPKPHTLYHITLRLPLRSFTVKKRYTDFLALHTSLATHAGTAPPVSPPPKHFLYSTVNNPQLTEERRVALESYLRALLTHPDSCWRDTAAWRSFLSLPSTWKSASAATPQYSGLSSGQPIADPTVWLDSHRTLKSLLHDARTALSKRESASTPQESHESSAAAKRCLVKASSLITALSSGLDELAKERRGGSEKPELLMEGEIRRRRDLVSAARQERDALEMLANTLASIRATPAAAATSVDKKALFGGTPTQSRGRVLGAPLPETQKTRELDNEGVLQLQKQVIQEQDQGVENLLRIVKRHKEMGIAIGEELDIQTKMLEELGDDVDRVDKKTKIARKRADKIS